MGYPLRPRIQWKTHKLHSAQYIERKAPDYTPRHSEANACETATAIDVPLHIVPPFETSVAVRVVDNATRLAVTLAFFNLTDTTIREGYFSFPFPSGCSLTQFRCVIGEDNVIYSKVKPRSQAIAEFEGPSTIIRP